MEQGHSDIDEIQILLQSVESNIKETDAFKQFDCSKNLQDFFNSSIDLKMVDTSAISLIPSEENPKSEEQMKWVQNNISELFPNVTSSQK